MSPGRAGELAPQRLQTLDDQPHFFSQKKARVQCHLIVAASRGVEFSADGADLLGQTALDVHVNIFVGWRESKLAAFDLALDRFQSAHDLPRIARGDDPLARQHFGVSDAPGDIVPIKARIDIDRRREGLYGARRH